MKNLIPVTENSRLLTQAMAQRFRRMMGLIDDPSWDLSFAERMEEVEQQYSLAYARSWLSGLDPRHEFLREGWVARQAALRNGETQSGCGGDMLASLDLDLLRIEPVQRPSFISDKFLNVPENEKDWDGRWTGGPPRYDGRVVIGEKTTRRDYRRTQTIHRSLWARHPSAFQSPTHSFNSGATIASYFRGDVDVDDTTLLTVANPFLPAVGIAPDWIALNPTLATAHQLKPCRERTLGWQDQSGIIAESIYWCDGPVHRRYGGDVAEGWLVLATPEFVKESLGFYPAFEWINISEESEDGNFAKCLIGPIDLPF